MVLNPINVKNMYTGMVTNHYDLPISHFFKRYKQLAFNDSSIKSGDSVLVFCCGTGLDFPYILKKIGKEGRIVGDEQLASGWQAFFNPVMIFMGKRFGATREGHQNSLELYTHMRADLEVVRKKEFFLKTYFNCIGRKERESHFLIS